MTTDLRSKRRKPGWLKALIVLGAIILALILAVWYYDASGRWQVEAALAEARKDGQPVTLEELEAARKVWPDDENGANVILSISARLDEIPYEDSVKLLPIIGDTYSPPLGRRWPEEIDHVVTRELSRLSGELATIDRLRDYQGGRFPLTFAANPVDTPLPHLAQLRASLKLKTLQATQRAMHSETAQLVEDMRVMRSHGQLLADEPTLISALVYIACDALTVSTIEEVCGLATLTPDQMKELDSELADMEATRHLVWGYRADRAFYLACFDWIGSIGQAPQANTRPPQSWSFLLRRGLLYRDEAFALGLHARLVASAESPQKTLKAIKEVDEAIGVAPLYCEFTKLVLPSVARSLELHLRLTAKIRAARVALAIERYRLETGAFPQWLEQLVPAYLDRVPVDPFDLQPLRYIVDDEAAVIYSISEDMTDDGGHVERRTTDETARDEGFVLLAPSLRNLPPVTQPAPENPEDVSVLQ